MRKRLRAIRRGIAREFKAYKGDRSLDMLPIRRGFRGYTAGGLKADVRAGLNVALLAFPQGMAYATVAGLPIYYGITCSIIAA